MPAKQRTPLISLRGGEEYAAFLDKLRKEVGGPYGVEVSRHRLAEIAIEFLSHHLGIDPPTRARPAHRPRKPPA